MLVAFGHFRRASGDALFRHNHSSSITGSSPACTSRAIHDRVITSHASPPSFTRLTDIALHVAHTRIPTWKPSAPRPTLSYRQLHISSALTSPASRTRPQIYVARHPLLKMPETAAQIIAKLPERFEKANAEGDLLFFPSTIHTHEEHGVEWEIRLCPALQHKPHLPTPHFDAGADERRSALGLEGRTFDPFTPPYVPNLHLGDLKDEVDGDEYVVLFNKYSVVRHHILLVTKDFHSQTAPLMPPDLVQAYQLLIAAQKAGKKYFAFYNCGDLSGASQPHKHLQLIPVDADGPPVEKLARKANIEVQDRPFSLHSLPYANHIRRFPPSLPNASRDELETQLQRAFMDLLDLALSTFRRDPPAAVNGAAGKSTLSYNVVLTLEHMHVVPRKAETYTLPATGDQLSINSMGFAGCLLVKSEAEFDVVVKEGVGKILGGVACKSIHEQQCDDVFQL
ncbi:ATP adenylyltransferase-like protein [Phanerochaete sordida]|uniref:ATP adenylyltransferase-like protein n=1 Tax=Phanerochaete sordida TaxID=48140 RepID=A0A9P3LF66_9APHY|nr:ATP adenylyltransferase-like protein [Phanerochaete sordida]